MDFSFKIGGAAGEGVMVMGRTAGKLFTRGGYYVFGYPEYPSLIRGGHNSYQVRISDEKILSPSKYTNIVVALNKNGVKFHKDSLAKDGILLFDSLIDISGTEVREDIIKCPLPVLDLLKEANAEPRMANVLFLGAMIALVKYPIEMLNEIIRQEFSRKGEEIVNKNISAARVAYEYVIKNFKTPIDIKPIGQPKVYISGNEAVGVGAIAAGMRFFASYPMTPATNLLHFLVQKQKDEKIVLVQTEDEITAAQMMIGAFYAGARGMVGTSGGGFALMTESVGMSALAETPSVFYIAQRVGPSTGMPTWTEQGDIFQVLGAGQGEFLRIILAPGDVEECFYQTAEAFNLAERYQLPVFILSDKFLAESHYTADADSLNAEKIKIDRGKVASNLAPLAEGERFHRYMITEDGISPRTFPGMENGEHVASSYEHREDSFTTEDFDMRAEQVNKRAKKLERILEESWEPNVYGDGSFTLVVWGSQKGPALEAQKLLKTEGIDFRVVHFSWLYPLNKDKVSKILGNGKKIIAENNSTAMFAKLLKMETGIEFDTTILKYTGRQFFPEQLAMAIKEGMNGRRKIVIKEGFDNFEFYYPWKYEVAEKKEEKSEVSV
ncbi:MAG: 2-oxoacid:acceptor oxidoreductase subunit alpha [Candidatus Anstonellales archaeon]